MKKQELTLVILAAGLGTRFGAAGQKQITVIGPNGEFIIDYSIYEAIQAGFNRIVLIIKEEQQKAFEESVGARIKEHLGIDIEYVYQKMTDVPEGTVVPQERTSPWGTSHALYAARDVIDGPFALISADDYYGPKAFTLLAEGLKNGEDIIVGYEIGGVLSKQKDEEGNYKDVKRGIIFTNENNELQKVIESKAREIDGGVVYCRPLNGSEPYTIGLDHPASMLMFGFQSDFMDFLSKDIKDFFENNKDVLASKDTEALLPDTLERYRSVGNTVKCKKTDDTWLGITYPGDVDVVKEALSLIYPNGVATEKPVQLRK